MKYEQKKKDLKHKTCKERPKLKNEMIFFSFFFWKTKRKNGVYLEIHGGLLYTTVL